MLSTLKHVQELSWNNSDSEIVEGLTLNKKGIAILKDVGITAPFNSIRSLFDELYNSPKLVQRLNEVYRKRGIFKSGPRTSDDVDKKVPFDLSPARMMAIMNNDPDLVNDLGPNFLEVVRFFTKIQDQVIKRLLRIAAQALNGGINPSAKDDLRAMHKTMNFNYRLLDYFSSPTETGRRCGEHRDYGTFTVIFQDEVGGLEFQNGENGEWTPIPAGEVVFLWGWSATILSNGRLSTPLHRVRGHDQTRRNAAVFFVAPDLNAELSPRLLSPSEELVIRPQRIFTVEDFKALMGYRWRAREGTLCPDDEAEQKVVPFHAECNSQDEAIRKFFFKA